MASLADELDLDPAFDDINLNNGGGMSMDFNHEHSGYESVEESPKVARRGKRSRGAGRRVVNEGYSSDDAGEQHMSSLGGANEGFSLADELGGGGSEIGQPRIAAGSSLAEEVGGEHGGINGEEDTSKLDAIDDETKARKDQEHYLMSSEILNESLRTTENFLAKLQRTAGVSDTGRGNVSIPSSYSNTSINGIGGGTGTDDTSILEGRAGDFLKQMRECSSSREDQVRELQECDRLLRRALEEGGDWISALANVDEFENEETQDSEPKVEDDRDLSFISATQTYRRNNIKEASTTSTDAASVRGALLQDEAHESISQDLYSRSPLSPITLNEQQSRGGGSGQQRTSDIIPDLSICQQLSSLQHSTSDLVTSLGSIHEQSQIASASMNDAARRIRSIKTVLTNWNDELRAVEHSRSCIASWESEERVGGPDARPRDVREWTQSHMDKFQRLLNDADIRARELLSPVRDPILDQLAAQG